MSAKYEKKKEKTFFSLFFLSQPLNLPPNGHYVLRSLLTRAAKVSHPYRARAPRAQRNTNFADHPAQDPDRGTSPATGQASKAHVQRVRSAKMMLLADYQKKKKKKKIYFFFA